MCSLSCFRSCDLAADMSVPESGRASISHEPLTVKIRMQARRKQFYGGTANFMMAINCVGGTVIKFNGIVISVYIHT